MNKNHIAVIAVIAVLCIFVTVLSSALFFYLGRESVKKEIAVKEVVIRETVPSAEKEISSPQQPVSQTTFIPYRPSGSEAPPPAGGRIPAAPDAPALYSEKAPLSETPAAGGASDAAQVRAYFQTFDSLTFDTGIVGETPDAFAQRLLQSITSGDTSAFDEMRQNFISARNTLSAAAAPASCKEHKRLSLQNIDDSLVMLDTLESTLVSGDVSAVSKITAMGKQVQDNTKNLEKTEAALRKEYNIPKK